jgi:hypothetical protein
MQLTKKSFLLVILLSAGAVLVSAEEQIIGRLIKASISGADTTKLYEPLVYIKQSSVLGVQNFTLKLTGIRARDSKQYEFYNDSSNTYASEVSAANIGDSIIWRRRSRNITVKPLNTYITLSLGNDNTNIIVINYEYRGKKGFGNVVYMIAVEK